MKIRKAIKNDAFEIARVHVASWQSAYKGIFSDEYLHQLSIKRRAEAWETLFADMENSCVDVAEDMDKIVAFASAGLAREEIPEFDGELYAIYADPKYFGSGVGKILFEKCVEYLHNQGWSSFYCWVLEDNKLGRDFYERIGGKVVVGRDKIIERDGKKLKEVVYGWKYD